jgi:hypothetical protein
MALGSWRAGEKWLKTHGLEAITRAVSRQPSALDTQGKSCYQQSPFK